MWNSRSVHQGEEAKRQHGMIPVGSVLGNLTQSHAAKVDSGMGRRIYHHRMAIAEPVFANIRTLKR